ncbi:MAG: hypothetical protein DRI73_01415, partial [Bacteroidetes bacterium]
MTILRFLQNHYQNYLYIRASKTSMYLKSTIFNSMKSKNLFLSIFFLAAVSGLGFVGIPGIAKPDKNDLTSDDYEKFEYKIPMRDGVKLFTSVYVPKDKS